MEVVYGICVYRVTCVIISELTYFQLTFPLERLQSSMYWSIALTSLDRRWGRIIRAIVMRSLSNFWKKLKSSCGRVRLSLSGHSCWTPSCFATKVLKHVKPCMRQAGVMTDQVDGWAKVRTSDLENGSSNRHSVYNSNQLEDARVFPLENAVVLSIRTTVHKRKGSPWTFHI